jgi:hypothetical protein
VASRTRSAATSAGKRCVRSWRSRPDACNHAPRSSSSILDPTSSILVKMVLLMSAKVAFCEESELALSGHNAVLGHRRFKCRRTSCVMSCCTCRGNTSEASERVTSVKHEHTRQTHEGCQLGGRLGPGRGRAPGVHGSYRCPGRVLQPAPKRVNSSQEGDSWHSAAFSARAFRKKRTSSRSQTRVPSACLAHRAAPAWTWRRVDAGCR